MRNLILKQELWDNARIISTNIDAVFRPIVEKNGLTLMQNRILNSILHSEHATVGCIGKTIDMSCGNLSNMLKKLEKEGYIIRARSQKDERVVELKLTDMGKLTIGNIENEILKKYSHVLQNKSDEDFITIISGLKKLNELLDELETKIRE